MMAASESRVIPARANHYDYLATNPSESAAAAAFGCPGQCVMVTVDGDGRPALRVRAELYRPAWLVLAGPKAVTLGSSRHKPAAGTSRRLVDITAAGGFPIQAENLAMNHHVCLARGRGHWASHESP